MINVTNITYKYGRNKKAVLENFSLKLEENNIYGLLGKNGAGKSTLLYLLSGLLRPCSGSVEIDGMAALRRDARLLAELFLVPEEFELPSVSLDEYVRLNQSFYPRFSREVLNRCLSDFELPDFRNISELSMGQKKKVFMSFALAAGTRYLLMDEPTNGLDIPSKSQFRKVVAQNMQDDRTLLIATHQVHDVEQLLDHVLLLGTDGLLLNSSVADICERYAFEYRSTQQMDDSVIYAEPSLQGNAVVVRRQPGDAETPLNLELLFNAVTRKLINQ
jgi:ABC-2 type transport system ATP-binding protein